VSKETYEVSKECIDLGAAKSRAIFLRLLRTRLKRYPVCESVCVCLYTYMYIYGYIYTHTHTYVCVRVCVCVSVCVCVCVYVCMYVCIYTAAVVLYVGQRRAARRPF